MTSGTCGTCTMRVTGAARMTRAARRPATAMRCAAKRTSRRAWENTHRPRRRNRSARTRFEQPKERPLRHPGSRLTRFRLAAAACCLALASAARPAFAGANAPAAAEPPTDAQRPAILVYHRFSSSAPPDSMTVRVSTFGAQLAFLRAHGYTFVPLRDVVAWAASPSAPLPDKAIAITVDDGHRSVYELLRPIVLRERLPVTLFIYPSAISNASYAMTWDELRALRATGRFDIESHTWWHPNFRTERRRLAPDAFRRFAATQFAHSRARLEREIGGPVDLLAWPFGLYDDELTSLAAQAGYVAGFTLDARKVRRGDAPLALPRLLIVDSCTPAVLARMLGERGDARADSHADLHVDSHAEQSR
nr:polysaccharide deacetylase family protein [Burkholderia pseudomallei]